MVGSDAAGSSPPPSSSSHPAEPLEPAAVTITVSSAETECPADGERGDPLGGGAAVVEQGKGEAGAPGPETGACVVVDVSCNSSRGEPAESDDWEKVCRICHLSPEQRGPAGSEMIQLGCGCKGQLGCAHRHCAETWFRLKGNRYCEICGVNAKNIIGVEDNSFMEEWHGRRMVDRSSNRNSSERDGCWRGQPFCNFLMAFLVIAFIFSWFFRINIF